MGDDPLAAAAALVTLGRLLQGQPPTATADQTRRLAVAAGLDTPDDATYRQIIDAYTRSTGRDPTTAILEEPGSEQEGGDTSY